MCKIILLLNLLLIAAIANSSSPENNAKSELSVWPKQKQELAIELAIFYDTGFDQIFQYDPRKIQQYWEVVMYDLHLRFQTLSSFRTSFRVTSLNVYKNPESQSLSLGIEGDDNGSFYVNELQKHFQTWLYAHREHIPSFDIAFLVTSDRPEINFLTDPRMPGSVCKAKDHKQKKWLASAVISAQSRASIAEVLSNRIASILGAPSDDDKNYWDICPYNNTQLLCCIMSQTRPNFVAQPKFFSNCTNYHLIQKLLFSNQKNCLDGKSSEDDPIIDSTNLFKNPSRLYAYSPAEQCAIYMHDNVTNFDTVPKHIQCLEQYCVNTTSQKNVYAFTVLEGSRCGYKGLGRCFRGKCIQLKVNLVNIATGKCLVSEKSQFASNDKPVLQNCSKVITQELTGTPVKRVPGRDDQELYIIKVTYSNRQGTGEKRLILDKDCLTLRFSHRAPGTKWIVDITKRNNGQSIDFLMQSESSGLCLKAAEDGVNVEVTTDCFGEDWAARWRFDFPVDPEDIVKNIDTFYDIDGEKGVEGMSVLTGIVTSCVVVGLVGFSPLISLVFSR